MDSIQGRSVQSTKTTLALTCLTLIAFAANSILCRAALSPQIIDPLAFTSIRLISGAIFLAALVLVRDRSLANIAKPKWRPAIALGAYAIAFSLAYVSLSAGTGALLLFASVQITMIGIGVARGDRPSLVEWIGISIAVAGLIYLLLPGFSAPPLFGAVLMILSGIGWGLYSLYGKSESDPVIATARNFLSVVPIALLILAWPKALSQVSSKGVWLAISSGVIASGGGYVIWYAALRGLRATSASIVQLAVPIIAAMGGIIFLSENLSLRLVVASLLILGGILTTILGSQKASP